MKKEYDYFEVTPMMLQAIESSIATKVELYKDISDDPTTTVKDLKTAADDVIHEMSEFNEMLKASHQEVVEAAMYLMDMLDPDLIARNILRKPDNMLN